MLQMNQDTGGLTPELERLLVRAGLRAVPAEAMCWRVSERAFGLRNWALQRAYLGELAEGFERLAPVLEGASYPADAGYQAMAACSLIRIAQGIHEPAIARLVAATLAAAGRMCPRVAATRLVACLVDLAPWQIELLRLYADPGPHAGRPDLALGRRSAELGSERAVQAGADRLHALGLVAANQDVAPDFRERSLMPRAPTELGRALLDLVPPSSDVAHRAERRAGHVLRVEAQGR